MIQAATQSAVAGGHEPSASSTAIDSRLPSPAELARRYGGEIHRVAFRVTRSDAAAQDIMQDVFVRIMLSGGFDASRGSVGRWLQIVTQNTAIDWIRREAAHQQRVGRVGALHSASSPVVEESVMAQLQAAQVRAAVVQLPDDERQVVVLAFYAGLSYRQVAERLELAEGTVKSRIRRALTRLAHHIGTPE